MGLSVRPWKPAERSIHARMYEDMRKQIEARKKASAELKKKIEK